MEIRDSQILITGANRGIGRAVALMCAEDKAHLHLVMRKEDPAIAEEMKKAGAKSVAIYELDLCDRSQIDQFLKKMESVQIDILFNNAGQMTGGLLEKQSLDEIYSMVHVNVMAVIHLTHGILPGMLKRKRGKIINNSSVTAVMNLPSATTYAASKAAILAFGNCLRTELKETSVTTLTLLTPGVDSQMFGEIPKFYGAKLDFGILDGIPPKKYAQMIREAILEDLEELRPSGLTGASLLVAHHLPKFFENLVLKRFRRS